MFVTGAAMWWNRVGAKKLRARRSKQKQEIV
jgi:hypothetical protein